MGTHTESNYHTQICFWGEGILRLVFARVTVCMFSEIEDIGVKHTEHKTLQSVINGKIPLSKAPHDNFRQELFGKKKEIGHK